MRRRISYKTLMIILVVGVSLSLIDYSNIISARFTYGVSMGKPYCAPCLSFFTEYKNPEVGDLVSYRREDGTGAIHKIVNKAEWYIISDAWGNRDLVTRENIFDVELLSVPLRKIDDTYEACNYINEHFKYGVNCTHFKKEELESECYYNVTHCMVFTSINTVLEWHEYSQLVSIEEVDECSYFNETTSKLLRFNFNKCEALWT